METANRTATRVNESLNIRSSNERALENYEVLPAIREAMVCGIGQWSQWLCLDMKDGLKSVCARRQS